MMERAVAQDPLWVQGRASLGVALANVGMFDRATAELEKALELDPRHWVAYRYLADVYLRMGKLGEALLAAETAYDLAPWSPSACAELAAVCRLTGNHQRAEELIQKVRSRPEHWGAFWMCRYHALCGDLDAASDWFDKAIEHRDPFVILSLSDPLLAPLRAHSRWPELMKKMNLPVAG